MPEVVKNAGEITAQWLTEALKERAGLRSSVTSVKAEQVGAGVGLMAELCRLTLEYEGDEDLPGTMIAKFAAQNENLAVAQLLDFYNRETNFYNKIGHDCPFRVPRSYYANVNQETYDFVLLMEDLGDVAPNDQLTGSTREEAFDKVTKIAELHARYWNKVDAPDLDWVYDFMSIEERTKLRDYVYQPAMEPAIEKFADHFSEETMAICRTVGERYVELFDALSDNRTFIHGDFRQDNFIYQTGSNEAVVMDWQISGQGAGTFDVAYFICQSLQIPLRREIEKELLQTYVDTLAENGVTDYDFDAAFRDYRLLILFCLVYPVTVCGTLDLANDRGRALAECMLDRNLAAIDDLGCGEFL